MSTVETETAESRNEGAGGDQKAAGKQDAEFLDVIGGEELPEDVVAALNAHESERQAEPRRNYAAQRIDGAAPPESTDDLTDENTAGRQAKNEPDAGKRFFSTDAWDNPERVQDDVLVAPLTALPDSPIERINQKTREQADPYSDERVSPQPDGGRGGVGAAEMYIQRVKDLRNAKEEATKKLAQEAEAARGNEATAAQVEEDASLQITIKPGSFIKKDGADTTKAASANKQTAPFVAELPAQPTICIVNSDNGKTLRDAQDYLRTKDPDLYRQTRFVAAFRSQQKLEQVRDSGIFAGHETDFQVVDENEPTLPSGTVLAIVSDLDQRAPHSLVKNPELGNVAENQTETVISGSGALAYYNPKTRRVEAVTPVGMQTYKTLESDQGVEILRPHTQRRVISESFVEGVNPESSERQPIYSVSLGKKLRNQEPAAYAYMRDKKDLWTHNYSPHTTTYMASIAGSADPNAIILTEAVPIRQPELVLTDRKDIANYQQSADKRPYDVIERDDMGNVTRVVLPGRYNHDEDNWENYVSPNKRGDVVAARGSQLVRYVVEADDQLYGAVSSVAPHVTVSGSPNRAGQFGYMVFDLTESKDLAQGARRTFSKKLNELGTGASTFTVASAREQLEKPEWPKDSSAKLIEEGFVAAVKESPQIARDYTLAIDLAEMYYRNGLPQHAVPHLRRAAKLMPIASAPDTLLARIHLNNSRIYGNTQAEGYSEEKLQAAQREIDYAMKAVERGLTKSPDSGHAYKLGVELLQQQQALFEQQRSLDGQVRLKVRPSGNIIGVRNHSAGPTIEQERASVARYIELAQQQVRTLEMLPEETAQIISDICTQVRKESELYQGDTTIFKTVLVHNIETGERELKQITVEEFMRDQAARRIRHAWSTTEQILEGGWLANPERVTNQLRNEIIGTIADEWERVRPRDTAIDPEGVLDPARPWLQFRPLSESEWPTTPESGQAERWIFVGELTDSDQEASIDILITLQETGASLEIQAAEDPAEATGEQVPQAEVAENDKDFFLGTVMEHGGRPLGGNFSIPLDILNSHALIVGATGSGKSTAIKLILEQCNGAGIHFCVVEAGQKPGDFYDMPIRMEDAGEVVYIRPGLDNVSLDLFMPDDGPPETEAQRVKACVQLNSLIWTMAYQMNNPFDSIFRTTLTRLYAEHGWDVGDPDMPATGTGQTVPTLEELRERLRLAVEVYNKSPGQKSDSGATISGFFDTRTDDQRTFMRNLVESGEPINLVEVVKNNNVVLRFDHFVHDDDRALAVSMALAIIAGGLIKERGTDNKGVMNNFIVLEEARNLLKDHGPNDEKGAARMAALSVLMTQLRSAGAGVAISTQTMDIHRDFRSQPALTIAGRAEDDDAKILADKLTSTEAREEEMAQRLSTLEPGQVFVKSRGKVTRVMTAYDETREGEIRDKIKGAQEQAKQKIKEARAEGIGNRTTDPNADTVELLDDVGGLATAPPIDKQRRERREVTAAAKAPDQAWMRIFARTVVLGHVAAEAGMTMPTQVPPELQQRWNEAVAQNPDRAQKLLATVVGRAVTKRVPGIKHTVHPRIVAHSALTTTLELLNTGLDDNARAALATQPMDMSQVSYSVSSYFTPHEVTWLSEYNKLTTPHSQSRPNARSRAQPLTGNIPGYSERKPDGPSGETSGQPYQTVAEQTLQLRSNPLSPLVHDAKREQSWVTLHGTVDDLKENLNDERMVTGSDPSQFSRRRRIAVAMGYCGLYDHGPSIYERVRGIGATARLKSLKADT